MDFDEQLHSSWFDMNTRTLKGMHQGADMPTAHTVADAAVLKDALKGPVGDCRPADVRYLCV